MSDPAIKDGIEWWDDDGMAPGSCARCGSSVEWLNCPNCGGGGMSHHDCGDDSCCCLQPEDNVACDWCNGTGGSWHCLSTPGWCRANPIKGREAIESTALNSRVWHDQ